VADLTTSRAADRAELADGEGGHVVVEHELLAELFGDAIDPLLVGAGAQDGCHQRLGLTALKEGRAMRNAEGVRPRN